MLTGEAGERPLGGNERFLPANGLLVQGRRGQVPPDAIGRDPVERARLLNLDTHHVLLSSGPPATYAEATDRTPAGSAESNRAAEAVNVKALPDRTVTAP